MVKLEVLLFAGCVDSAHGSDALSSTFEKSLGETDFKEPKSDAPAPRSRIARTAPNSAKLPNFEGGVERVPMGTRPVYWGLGDQSRFLITGTETAGS